MNKISNNQLIKGKLSGFTPIESQNLLTESQFNSLVKSNDLEVFTIEGLNQYRLKILSLCKENPDKEIDILKKAKDDFELLSAKEVILEDGKTITKYVRTKLVKGKEEEDEEEEEEEEEEETPPVDNEKEEAPEGEDTKEEKNHLDFEDEPKKEGEEKEEQSNPDEKEEKTDNPLNEDEAKVLTFIAASLKDGNKLESSAIAQGAKIDENQISSIISSLTEKGLITSEDGNSITAISDEGKALLTGDDGKEEDEDGEEEGDDNKGKEGEETPIKKDDEGNNDSELEKLKGHAKNTHSDHLKDFIKSPTNKEEHKQIAKDELLSRGEKIDESNDTDNPDNKEEGNSDEDSKLEAEKKFKKWVDAHFNEHDVEDLSKIVKDLIMQSPGKRKELKEHYKTDYQQSNGGNTLSKIDAKEFDEWLDQYLTHLPFNDLKDYAAKLAYKNPKFIKKLKSDYDELNTSGMLDDQFAYQEPKEDNQNQSQIKKSIKVNK